MRDPNSKRLYKAAHNGDVRTLQEIAGRYPSLLYGGSWAVAPYDCLPEPPLQVAAFCGHLHFVERILAMEPALAHHPDERGLSPLHMAAAKGRVNIITRLLRHDPDLCFLCDDDGRNPLHFAAMNGRLAALQLLVGQIGARQDAASFVNAKDNHGFTLLHLAVFNKHPQIVQYLVTLEIDMNALNSRGLTPLDMLMDYPMPMAYPNLVKTANLLRRHGATRSSTLTSTASQEIWARKKDALMVVASIIATMAFQAAVNPPGGVWQEDGKSGQIAGKSVMAAKNPNLYILFVISATSAFVFSLLELSLHMSTTISNGGDASEGLLVYAKYLSTVGLVAAYLISVGFLTRLPDGQAAAHFGVLICITGVVVLVFVVVALRFGFVGRERSASALRTLIRFPPPK